MGGVQHSESSQFSESCSVLLQLEFRAHRKRSRPTHHAIGGKVLFLNNEDTPSSCSPPVPCGVLPSASGYQRQRVKHGGRDRPTRSRTRRVDSAGREDRK